MQVPSALGSADSKQFDCSLKNEIQKYWKPKRTIRFMSYGSIFPMRLQMMNSKVMCKQKTLCSDIWHVSIFYKWLS